MAELERKGLVKDQTSTTGTSDFVVDGVAATGGFFTIAAKHTNGRRLRYVCRGPAGVEEEVGEGTWNSGTSTLTRDTVIESTNGGAKVSFSAGAKELWIGPVARDFDVPDFATGANIASAGTINLDTATGGRVHVTGTTGINTVTLTRGPRTVIFDGILTLTHHATNNNLPGAANITTAAGDRAVYESDGTTVYCIAYIRAADGVVTLNAAQTLTNKTLTSPTLGGTVSFGANSITAGAGSLTHTAPANSPMTVYSQGNGTNGYGAFYPRGDGNENSYIFMGNAGQGELFRITVDASGTYIGRGNSATTRLTLLDAGHLNPGADGTQNLGDPSAKWANIYGELAVMSSGAASAAAVLSSSGSTSTLELTDTGGNGAGLKMTGNGATTPSKWLRMISGALEFINNAYNAVIFKIEDDGDFSWAGVATGNGSAITTLNASNVSSGTLNAARVDQTAAYAWTGAHTHGDADISRMTMFDCAAKFLDKGNSGTSTQTYDYTAAAVQQSTATGNHTIAFSNPPPTASFGAFLMKAINFGAFTVTWPTINWVKPDGTTTTSVSTWLAANSGRTAFQTSGIDLLKFWTDDAGTTWYGGFAA
jgi:hypothetical protein